MASENDFTIGFRRSLIKNKELAGRLVHHKGAVPMVFQYNPLDFYIESSPDGELLISPCRPNYLAPKVRYNINGTGHVIRFPELKRILAEFNVKPEELGSVKADLPILFHYGRSDSSVAYFGAKVRPSDIQEVVMRIPDLIHVVNSFTLYTTEDETMDKLFVVRFEMKRVQNGLARRICRN